MPAIGTTKLPELDAVLTQHGAKLKAAEVHALYLGALTSTSTRLGPQHLLERIFGDEQAPDMAAFSTVLGYWNHLLNERSAGRVRLVPLPLPAGATVDDLSAYASRRHAEILWFIRGIDAGGDDPIEFGPHGQLLLRKIAEADAFLEAYAELLQREPADAKTLREGRIALLNLIETVEQLIAELMTVSDAVRREAISTFLAQQGRMTDDGVPIARPSRVPRNGPCPCGSGKKWKKCCGSPLRAQ